MASGVSGSPSARVLRDDAGDDDVDVDCERLKSARAASAERTDSSSTVLDGRLLLLQHVRTVSETHATIDAQRATHNEHDN